MNEWDKNYEVGRWEIEIWEGQHPFAHRHVWKYKIRDKFNRNAPPRQGYFDDQLTAHEHVALITGVELETLLELAVNTPEPEWQQEGAG